jgi:hypothetical protein
MSNFEIRRATTRRECDPDCTFHIFVDPPGDPPSTRRRETAYILCDNDALHLYHETLISPDRAKRYKPDVQDGEQILVRLRNERTKGIDKFELPVKVKLVDDRGGNYLRIGLQDIYPHFDLNLSPNAQILILDLNEQMAKQAGKHCFHVS